MRKFRSNNLPVFGDDTLEPAIRIFLFVWNGKCGVSATGRGIRGARDGVETMSAEVSL